MRSGHTAPQITTHVLKLNVRVRALERARARPSRPRAAARGTPGPCPCGPGAPARARRENKTRIYFWENFSISRESFSRFTGNSTTLCQNLRNSRSESKTTMGMARHRPPCLSSLASAQTPHYEDPACSKSDPGIDETATPRSVDLSHGTLALEPSMGQMPDQTKRAPQVCSSALTLVDLYYSASGSRCTVFWLTLAAFWLALCASTHLETPRSSDFMTCW